MTVLPWGDSHEFEAGLRMMGSDRELLTDIVSQAHKDTAPAMKADDFFELFTAEQVLKSRSYELDSDQLTSGIMGSKQGRDGGVDSIYLFINRKLIRADTDLNHFKGQQVDIDLIVTQSKDSPSFEEGVIDKFRNFLEDCLRLSSSPAPQRAKLYKEQLLEAVATFHTAIKSLVSQRPTLSITFCYANTGEQVSDGVTNKRDQLIAEIREAFSTAKASFEFFGAKRLFWLATTRVSRTFPLITHKAISKGDSCYICLVELGEFFKFIDDGGVPRASMFEANVRDYNGDVSVNQGIAATLALPEDPSVDFWWLNNGITIIASDAGSNGDLFQITDPMIVNGLQTSYELHKYLNDNKNRSDKRTILARIIKTTKPESVDRIIKATNSQTKIPSVWLHATEEIHRKIEIALKGVGLFYDRRKNHYRNQGVPPKSIVTLPYLAQALAAIVLRRPDDARARPTTVVETHYRQLFPAEGSTEIYCKCALIQKRIDEFLDGYDVDRGERLNVAFYLAMYATCVSLQSANPPRNRIAAFDVDQMSDAFLTECLVKVLDFYGELGGGDAVAKGPHLAVKLRKSLAHRFGQSDPTRKRKKHAKAA